MYTGCVMTREMLLTKSLEDLREIARTMGVKAITRYRKGELADIIMNSGVVPESVAAGKSKRRKEEPEAAPETSPEAAPVPTPEAAPAPAAEAASAEVDYAPRRRGRPRKAINDPAPAPAQEAEAPSPEAAEAPASGQKPAQEAQPVPQAPDMPAPAGMRGYQRVDIPQPAQWDRQYPRQQDYQPRARYDRAYSGSDYQQRGSDRGGRYQQRDQNRYYNDRADYNRTYQQGRNYDQSRDYQDYRQGYPMYPQDMQRGFYPQEGDPAFRGQGYYNAEYGTSNPAVPELLENGDCGDAEGILDIANDGYGFLRCENYLPGPKDVYISNAQIRRFRLKNGDKVTGKTRPSRETDKYPALLYITAVNDCPPEDMVNRRPFEELVPIFPNERFTLDLPDAKPRERLAIRLIDLMAPIGRGQRGMIVSQPKAGKTTLLKNIANGISTNYPDVTLIVLLIDERPEEVTDMQRSIKGEVVYSTFDEQPERHTKVAEMVMERSMRLVEQGKDVVVLLDSITRLARAYNLTINSTGKTLSGGMDPGALHKPKRFFGAARNIENGGSLTVIATALVETGSRMDDMVYEEFKGTGNMEIHLDRKLSERRIFPAIDIYKSGTRRDELLLSPEDAECANTLRRMLSAGNTADVAEQVIEMMVNSETDEEFREAVRKLAGGYESKGFTLGRNFMRHY